MSHSIVKQFIHFMWSTENQNFLIPESVRNELYAYLTNLVHSKSGKTCAFGGTSDHLHVLTSLPADISISSFMGYLKAYSSKWIKLQNGIHPHFTWQKGYAAVSLQEDRVPLVSQYIKEDEKRHIAQKTDYPHELFNILKQQNIPFQDQYLMINSYANVILHIVWSTYNRHQSLNKSTLPALYSQIETICTQKQSKLLSIGGVQDHVHALVAISKNIAVSDLLREIKTGSSMWLKLFNYSEFKNFEWQTGYGAFSVSLPNIEIVKNYIENQEEHHKQQSSTDEWNRLFFDSKF